MRIGFCTIIALLSMLCGHHLRAAEGGLRLTGRALVALPQDNHRVFLTWRLLNQDQNASFDVLRGQSPDQLARVASAQNSTTLLDSPGQGTFHYCVVPTSGPLKGIPSNIFAVTTSSKGRDWVEILPAMKGKKLQFSDRHFADIDGDGELEFLTYYPQVPSYRGGVSAESYKLQAYKLLDPAAPRWTFDTGMGLQSDPASGDFRADWDYEWTFKPVAHDIDGDFKAEIITLARIDGKYQYVVLKDQGATFRVMARMDSPIPVGDKQNNSRHFPFFANLGGQYSSFCLQGGTYGYWEMWTYDWTGSELKLRWHVKSTAPDFKGNRSSSHTVLVADLDADGKDEISNGATLLDDDGSVLWSANKEFGPNNHIDGQVIDDIDPNNPGLEIAIHTEQGNKYALYDARTGKLLWLKEAPGRHLQLNIAAIITGGPGLDILGTFGGHKPTGSFACRSDGTDLPYPFPDKPLNGDRWWPMDWDGDRGRNVCMNFTRIYGPGGKLLHQIDLSDAPQGDLIPVNEHKLNHLWFNVDIVGDYREDIPVQMPDGSVRVYLNTAPLPRKKPCKWQSRSYEFLQAPGDYRYFIRVLEELQPQAMAAPRIRLITRGDDAGSCASADRAILESAQKGILKNVSIMVPGPTFEQAAGALRELRGVALGLHVTLNAEWDTVKWGPVLPREKVPSLVDENGHFTATPRLLNERKASVDEMIAEVRAQLEKARKAGLNIQYMDEHMGVGWLPGLRDRLKALARQEGLLYSEGFPGLPKAPQALTDQAENLVARLKAAPPGTYLLVTHPGFDAPDMQQFRHVGLEPGQIAKERDADRRMWQDPRVRQACTDLSVAPVRYTDVAP